MDLKPLYSDISNLEGIAALKKHIKIIHASQS